MCGFFFLMIRRPPRSTRTDTLSLHDALPIYHADRAPMRRYEDAAGAIEPDIAPAGDASRLRPVERSEEHTSELQSLMRISYAVFCLKKKNTRPHTSTAIC